MESHLRIRASDSIDASDLQNNGFVVRTHTPIRTIYRFAIFLAIITVGVELIVYFEALNAAILCTVVGMVMVFLSRELERQKKLQQSTEFMNALFASALAQDCLFCLAVRHDGKIIYINRTFQELFPAFISEPIRSLALFLTAQKLTPDLCEAITQSVAHARKISLPVTLTTDGDKKRSVMLQIDPIERPSGFVLIRGK
ncbi:MAG: hypothetical protein EBR02_06410 [Alphaproteobacteria bacterium]|nr:hypothetical protein [Alphaproteobacteria bacterium]